MRAEEADFDYSEKERASGISLIRIYLIFILIYKDLFIYLISFIRTHVQEALIGARQPFP